MLPSLHMIGSLRGTVLEIHSSDILLEVHGVGYRIKGPVSVLSSLLIGEECFLYIHDHVREDARDVFGFLSRNELELFEQLLGVSGVGPKVALTLLSAGSVEAIRRAVMQGDLTLLTSVPGVGKKTAQKIILDLKGQLVEVDEESSADREVIEALVSLGYTAHTAREAVKSIPSVATTDVSLRVREALKQLAK